MRQHFWLLGCLQLLGHFLCLQLGEFNLKKVNIMIICKKSDPSVIDTGDKEDMDNGEINQKDNGDDDLKNELYEHGQSTSTVAA